MGAMPPQTSNVAWFRRFVGRGWVNRRSDGTLVPHPALLRLPKSYLLAPNRHVFRFQKGKVTCFDSQDATQVLLLPEMAGDYCVLNRPTICCNSAARRANSLAEDRVSWAPALACFAASET